MHLFAPVFLPCKVLVSIFVFLVHCNKQPALVRNTNFQFPSSGQKKTFFSGSHLAPKYYKVVAKIPKSWSPFFKVVANFKKVCGHHVYNDEKKKTFLPCHGNRSGFSIRIKVGGERVTCAAGTTF